MVLATVAEVAEVWEVVAQVMANPVWAKVAAEGLEVVAEEDQAQVMWAVQAAAVEDWAQVVWAIQAAAVEDWAQVMLVAQVLGDQWGDLAKLRPEDGEPQLELHGS